MDREGQLGRSIPFLDNGATDEEEEEEEEAKKGEQDTCACHDCV
jgi:hypothetical protein